MTIAKKSCRTCKHFAEQEFHVGNLLLRRCLLKHLVMSGRQVNGNRGECKQSHKFINPKNPDACKEWVAQGEA